MDKLPKAKAVREEAYIYVSEVYNPEHPLVLEAGAQLIEILNQTGDFYDGGLLEYAMKLLLVLL
jgi:hypothetical protein